MDAYYKDRKKQLNKYLKNIKKMVKAGKMEEVSQLKKEYIQLMTKPPPFKRDVYMTEHTYGQSLNQRIRESENKFIELKLDLCYDLHDTMKEYDESEKAVNLLKKNREILLSKKRERELLEERTQKQKKEQLKSIMETYFFLEPEDKKVTYKELENLSSQMANPTRQVIAYEIDHKELEYRLTQHYDPPLYPVKILV
jgi:hypothetical protein